MKSRQVLIISFWNPTEENPHQGVFIQDQAAAICEVRDNVIFLQVNVLFSKSILLKNTIEESDWHNNRRIVVNFYTRLWKLWYVNPWLMENVIFRTLRESGIRIKPEIIHSNVIFPCGVVGYLLSKRIEADTIISEHWSKAEKLLRHPLYKRIALKAYHKSFAIISVSQFLSNTISRITGHKNLKVVPNIIDTRLFTYQPKKLNENYGISFMCVASWRLPKRLDLIVDSLINYAGETDKSLELKVIGNGPQTEIMKNRRIPENLNIKWLGYLDKPSIASHLQSAHFFMHASETETFSIVTAEALSTGTPVIASNAGALPELINDQNGILADNNPESWLKSIREIVSKGYDYEAIAMQNQSKFSPNNIANRIISVYEEH
jgi:glycosyltransferase involved in cell wall biosynthesis